MTNNQRERQSWRLFLSVLITAIPLQVIAQLPPPACGKIPGCGQGPANVVMGVVVPEIARILLNSTAALSLIFVIVGGGRLLLSFGEEDAQTKARKTIEWALIGVIVAITSHRMVIAIISQQYVLGNDPILELFAAAVHIMTVLINVAFLISILLGGIRMVMARGKEDETRKGKMAILYAIVGAIVINVAPFVVKAIINL